MSGPSKGAIEAARQWNPQCADCINSCDDNNVNCKVCAGTVQHLAQALDAFASQAVAEELVACARYLDDIAKSWEVDGCTMEAAALSGIAASIRARSANPKA